MQVTIVTLGPNDSIRTEQAILDIVDAICRAERFVANTFFWFQDKNLGFIHGADNPPVVRISCHWPMIEGGLGLPVAEVELPKGFSLDAFSQILFLQVAQLVRQKGLELVRPGSRNPANREGKFGFVLDLKGQAPSCGTCGTVCKFGNFAHDMKIYWDCPNCHNVLSTEPK